MKTFIFTLMFLFPTVSWGQKAYVSLKECNNDTVKYLKTNFINNRERYINQPFSKLTKEFELDMYISQMYSGRSPETSQVWGLKFHYIYPSDEFYWDWENRLYYWFLIEFERPYITPPFVYSWNSKKNRYRNLFGDCIIKDMDVRPSLYRTPEEEKNARVGWKEIPWN